MAEVSKNNKILKFEVSARLNKDDEVSIFATDHDFAGLPFKVNILKGSNTHNSVLSVMEDYGMKTTEKLVDVKEGSTTSTETDSIPKEVNYPEHPLYVGNLIPLGVGENGNLIHIELPDVLFVGGPKGSGKVQLLNAIIERTLKTMPVHYIYDLSSLTALNDRLRSRSQIRSSGGTPIGPDDFGESLIVSDGFFGTENPQERQHLKGELKVLTTLISALPNVRAVLSIQEEFAELMRNCEPNTSFSNRTIIMGGSGKKAPIQGRGNGSRLFVNGERIPDGKRIYFQTYLTDANWIEKLSGNHKHIHQQLKRSYLAGRYSSPKSNWDLWDTSDVGW